LGANQFVDVAIVALPFALTALAIGAISEILEEVFP
jgi:hypothetical protein